VAARLADSGDTEGAPGMARAHLEAPSRRSFSETAKSARRSVPRACPFPRRSRTSEQVQTDLRRDDEVGGFAGGRREGVEGRLHRDRRLGGGARERVPAARRTAARATKPSAGRRASKGQTVRPASFNASKRPIGAFIGAGTPEE
jgi:hypothetical protein